MASSSIGVGGRRRTAASAAAAAAAAAGVVVKGGWDGLVRLVRQPPHEQRQPPPPHVPLLPAPLLLLRQHPVLFVSNPVRGDSVATGRSSAPAASRQRHVPRSRRRGNDDEQQQQQQQRQARPLLSRAALQSQQVLQQQLGARLLGIEQAFPIPSDHQLHHVHKLRSRFGGGARQGGVVVGVGSGAAIDLARSAAASSSSGSSAASHLLLAPATYVSVMVSGSASAGIGAAGDQNDGVAAPPLLLDSDEATLVPASPGSSLPSSSVTVLQIDPAAMAGSRSTSALAAASLLLDQIRRRHRGGQLHSPSGNNGANDVEFVHAHDLLGRLLRAADESDNDDDIGNGTGHRAADDEGSSKDDDPLWDAMYEVGQQCLRYDETPPDGGRSPPLPLRPLPLSVASSLALVIPHRTVPEIMAAAIPHLLLENDGASTLVRPEDRQRIHHMVHEFHASAATASPLGHSPENLLSIDECMDLVRTNRTLSSSGCRDDDSDDDELMRAVVTDLVAAAARN